jgi:hypothetical protein
LRKNKPPGHSCGAFPCGEEEFYGKPPHRSSAFWEKSGGTFYLADLIVIFIALIYGLLLDGAHMPVDPSDRAAARPRK